jgi:hypothetical protein
MARCYGRSPSDRRLVAAVPHGHRRTTTFVAGLRQTGIVAPLVLDGPMTGPAFRAYVVNRKLAQRPAARRAGRGGRPAPNPRCKVPEIPALAGEGAAAGEKERHSDTSHPQRPWPAKATPRNVWIAL